MALAVQTMELRTDLFARGSAFKGRPRERMLAVGLVITGVVVATGLTLQAMKDSMMFFVSVTEVAEGKYPADRNFRVGGLVKAGSVGNAWGGFFGAQYFEAWNVSFNYVSGINPIPVPAAAWLFGPKEMLQKKT